MFSNDHLYSVLEGLYMCQLTLCDTCKSLALWLSMLILHFAILSCLCLEAVWRVYLALSPQKPGMNAGRHMVRVIVRILWEFKSLVIVVFVAWSLPPFISAWTGIIPFTSSLSQSCANLQSMTRIGCGEELLLKFNFALADLLRQNTYGVCAILTIIEHRSIDGAYGGNSCFLQRGWKWNLRGTYAVRPRKDPVKLPRICITRKMISMSENKS